jgi:DNA-binding protein Fis
MNYFKIISVLIIALSLSAFVQAQEFEATILHKYVFLKWKWPSDNQPDHYEIERRNRGGDFSMVAMTFSGELNDTSSLYYKDKLTGVEDHYYYRIKAVYPDGNANYSEILSVSFEKTADQKMIDARLDSITGRIKLNLPPLNGSYICRIYNMNGVLLDIEKPLACEPELSLAKVEGSRFFIETYHPQTGKKFYSTFSRN